MTKITTSSKLKNKLAVSSFFMILTFGVSISIFIQSVLKKTLEQEGIDPLVVETVISKFTTLSLGFIIIFIILFVFVAIQSAKYLTRSITKLQTLATEIAKGNFDAEINFQIKNSGDEVGDLAVAFEHMLHTVRKSNIILEEKVQERTKDYEEAKHKEKEKLDELVKVNEVMIGRELKMIELKEEIKSLKLQLEGK